MLGRPDKPLGMSSPSWFKSGDWNFSSRAALLLLLHATSSISLTILNKLIATTFPHAFTLIFIQNVATVVLTFIVVSGGLLEMKPFQSHHAYKMAPMTVLYVLLLWSSMEGLPTVSVATVVIGRSLIPLLSCIIERFTFGTTFKRDSYFALLLIFLGSTIYTLKTNEFRSYGIRFVVINVILSVVTPILEKQIVNKVKEEQTPLGLVLYRNAMSLPLLLVIMAFKAENPMAPFFESLGSTFYTTLAFSSIFSFSIGFAVFMLQTEVTVTTIVTANNWYKLMTLLISLMVWLTNIPLMGWLGIFTNFAGVFWYSYLQSRK